MTRIFLTLATVSIILLGAAFVLGHLVDDPRVPDLEAQQAVQRHFLVALAGLVFACLVHAIVLTYFMGTGRWIEETSAAYKLSPEWSAANRALKYRALPGMVGAIVLLVITGALGGAADPASPVQFGGIAGLSATTIHFLAASLTLALNLMVNLWEYQALERNNAIIQSVLAEVTHIRRERGLPV